MPRTSESITILELTQVGDIGNSPKTCPSTHVPEPTGSAVYSKDPNTSPESIPTSPSDAPPLRDNTDPTVSHVWSSQWGEAIS